MVEVQGSVQVKPKLRGVSHEFAVLAALAGCAELFRAAPSPRAMLAAATHGASLVALFGASALYHRPSWPLARAAGPRRWLRRLDHAAIFLLIAGTYTPICLLIGGRPGVVVLTVVWGGVNDVNRSCRPATTILAGRGRSPRLHCGVSFTNGSAVHALSSNPPVTSIPRDRSRAPPREASSDKVSPLSRPTLLLRCVLPTSAQTRLDAAGKSASEEAVMLWAIAIIFLVLWALGLVSSYTLGGFIHLLLVLAVIALVVGFFQRRRVA